MGTSIIENSQNNEVRHKVVVNICNSQNRNIIIIVAIKFQIDSGDEFNVAGSSLLAILDDYALNYIKENEKNFLGNIGNQSRLHLF